MCQDNGDIAKWKERTSIEIWTRYTIFYKVDSLVNFDICSFHFILDRAFQSCQWFHGHKSLGFSDNVDDPDDIIFSLRLFLSGIAGNYFQNHCDH